MKYVRAVNKNQIPEGGRRRVDVEGRDVVLFNIEGAFYAINYRCPHAGAGLGDGQRVGKNLRCPQHRWLFDLETGKTRNDRRVTARLYPTKIEGDDVLVGIRDG